MPEHLTPSSAALSDAPNESLQQIEPVRTILSRSPHPYHRLNSELLEPSDRFSLARPSLDSSRLPGSLSRDATPNTNSDSGTEADDEHFLKGLPAPRTYLHKGLRGRNEVLSGTSTPIPSPALAEEDGRRGLSGLRRETIPGNDSKAPSDHSRRNKVLVRRILEFLILGSLAALVLTNRQVRPIVQRWRLELLSGLGVMSVLSLLYPIRLICWGYLHRVPSRKIPIYLPSSFDPAPLLYPPAISMLVSLLIAVDNGAVVLPNIILSLCSLPASLFPATPREETFNPLHWLTSCIPLFISETSYTYNLWAGSGASAVSPETLVLLYPLHQYLCLTLQYLTTTSLLTAELQLLSVALIDVLLLSSSPQAIIIKTMLWVGGLDILVSCSQVVRWGIALARVPKWRFKRVNNSKGAPSFLSTLMSWRRVRHDLFHASMDSSSCSSCDALDFADDSDDVGSTPSKGHLRLQTATYDGTEAVEIVRDPLSAVDAPSSQQVRFINTDSKPGLSHQRRHTLPSIGRPLKKSYTHTPSGRRKRSASSSVRAFFSLTQKQASVRKWMYALYVYVCIVATVFVPHPIIGVKDFVQNHALHGFEPVGWALGYLFGDLPWFRWQVVSNNLERWICLPPRPESEADEYKFGWVQYLRHNTFGEANTRLLLGAYYLGVIGCGLIVVFRLSPFYEVDTRRKVFHFMMVAMFAPSIYIDPSFVGLALSIVLALFLLLDLLRASQLPPLSKPLANFLAPYVDGRDLRGPVVISHIFLLIGCAIPLWLSLGSLPRSGTGYLGGWEVSTREVSMVSGVVCVGLGDAAASLIGRRWGHHKWLWGGGKSLEGSVAFATAVFLGLQAAHVWLRVGGWHPTTATDTDITGVEKAGYDVWTVPVGKSGVCAIMASLTEAVLTGGNDNVIVPIILWTCVKSLGV